MIEEHVAKLQELLGEEITVSRIGETNKISFTVGDKTINLKAPLTEADQDRVIAYLTTEPKKKGPGRPKKEAE